jgi:hypothetical protein
MKKIFTILLAIGSVTFASAQSKGNWGHDDHKDVAVNQPYDHSRDNNSGYGSANYSNREKDAQIQRINREFDKRIAAVQRDRRLRSYEKRGQINMIERERSAQIREVQMRFSRDQRNYRF